MYRSTGIDPSARAGFFPPRFSAAPPADLQPMGESAEILSRLAAARPDNRISQSELLSMAQNDHGDYSTPVQAAARNFFINRQAVYQAHEQVRRRGGQSRGFGGTARSYDYSDLQGMASLFGDEPPPTHRPGGSRNGGGNGSSPRSDMHGDNHVGADDYFQALRDMAGYLRGRRRKSVSLEGMMFMERQGNIAASTLLSHMPRIGELFGHLVGAKMEAMTHNIERMLNSEEFADLMRQEMRDAALAQARQAGAGGTVPTAGEAPAAAGTRQSGGAGGGAAQGTAPARDLKQPSGKAPPTPASGRWTGPIITEVTDDADADAGDVNPLADGGEEESDEFRAAEAALADAAASSTEAAASAAAAIHARQAQLHQDVVQAAQRNYYRRDREDDLRGQRLADEHRIAARNAEENRMAQRRYEDDLRLEREQERRMEENRRQDDLLADERRAADQR